MCIQILAGIGLLLLIALLGVILYMVYSDLFGKTKSKYRMLTPVKFRGHTNVLAENQPEYIPLPVFIDQESAYVPFITCWQFTFMDRLKVLVTGRIWASTSTFGNQYQPVTFTVNRSDVLIEKCS